MISKRRNLVNSYIQNKGEVLLSELIKIFPDVSSMTIRRDLEKLENQGDIVRTKGGAKSIAHLSRNKEEIYSLRANENVEAKTIIAKKALSFIEKGRSLYLDSGSTIMLLVKMLPEDNFFILTSGPNIALEAIKNPNSSVLLTGGNLNRDNLTVSGASTTEFIKNINIDIAFMAASGFSAQSGFTSGNFDECELKRHIISKATKKIMLMDTSKINKNMPYTFANLCDIDILITEKQLPTDIANEAKKYNVKII